MIRYKMFEREITEGDHRSYHVCVEKFGNNFNPKSKFYPIDQGLSKVNVDLSNYECNITLENHTSPNNYFHVSYLAKNLNVPYVERHILKAFDIDLYIPVLYFTRQYPFTKNYKVGFGYKIFKTFKSKFYDRVIKTMIKFDNYLNGLNSIILAGDFDQNGKFIDESINIEIIPYQNKDNYYKIRKLLLQDYPVIENKIEKYDKMFTDYTIKKFCWHTKIKLFDDREPVVKFYRTYPHNPFIKYYNYQ